MVVSGPTNGWYYVKLANGTYGYASASYVNTGTTTTTTASGTSSSSSGSSTAASSTHSIAQIQTQLNALGYVGADGKPLTVDGVNGANTQYAIKQFQKNAGLSVDGIAGTNTQAALFGSSPPKATSANKPTMTSSATTSNKAQAVGPSPATSNSINPKTGNANHTVTQTFYFVNLFNDDDADLVGISAFSVTVTFSGYVNYNIYSDHRLVTEAGASIGHELGSPDLPDIDMSMGKLEINGSPLGFHDVPTSFAGPTLACLSVGCTPNMDIGFSANFLSSANIMDASALFGYRSCSCTFTF